MLLCGGPGLAEWKMSEVLNGAGEFTMTDGGAKIETVVVARNEF